jgi:hypothetical protein
MQLLSNVDIRLLGCIMVSVSKAGRPGGGTPGAALDTCQSVLGGIVGTIIPLFMPKGQSCSELAPWRLLARLARATTEEMRTGLELLCVVDPVGFEVALPAARPDPGEDAELGEPVAVCGRCGSMVALFPEDLTWRHFRGALDVFGVQEAFDAGHEPQVEWYLPEELAEQLAL